MKNLTVIICIFLATSATFGVIALPPATSTNSFGDLYWAYGQNAASQNYYLVCGRVNRLESELNRLETAFLWLAIILGSSLSSVCVLAVRDQIRKRSNRPGFEREATEPQTTQGKASEAVNPTLALSGGQQTV